MKYKLLMELTAFAPKGQDSTAKKEINGGLGEVARKINLHVANGIPKKNIDLVIVVHAAALYAFMTNEKYKKRYKIDNPNLALIKELQDFGAKIIVCGQAMTFFNLEREDMVPGIKQALTAQTVLSSYQLKGYVFYNIKLD
jgi:intracellular sulfur oxidation DsrE/DsrF family protein